MPHLGLGSGSEQYLPANGSGFSPQPYNNQILI